MASPRSSSVAVAPRRARAVELPWVTETPATAAPRRARWAAIGVLIFCAALPLQWESLVDVPGLGNLRYFHLAAIVMVVLARPTWSSIAQVFGRSRPILEGMVAFIACNLLTAVGWGADPSDYVQRTTYFVLGLVGGACLLIALSDAAGRRVLVWASAVTIVVFSFNFYLAMVAARVNPVTTIERAVLSGDPSVIEFSLFRSSFNSSGDSDVRSNARHEIFAALVIVFAVSLVAGAVTRATRIVLALSGVATLALVFISQSRSILLAVVLALVVVLARVVITLRIKAGTVVTAVIVLAAAAVALPTVGNLLITRITQTKSYDARLGAFDLSSSEILTRLTFGGPRLETSTHNLIGDGALRGGFIAGVGAVLIVLGFVFIAIRALSAYFRTNRIVHFGAIMVMAVTLVRSFTAGGGQLQLTEWFGVGLALAVAIRTQHQPADEPAPPAVVVDEAVAAVPGPARRRARISDGRTAAAPEA